LSETLSQTENASFQLFCFPLICSVIIIALSTPIFYHSDKTKAQLIGSWPKQWNLLENSVIVSSYRKRQSDIAIYCSMDDNLVYQHNIQELMEELQLEHTSAQWRPFIDSSKASLKAVLLQFPSVPLAHPVHIK
jgi:hypothetical protein